jgi:hypothetical protein
MLKLWQLLVNRNLVVKLHVVRAGFNPVGIGWYHTIYGIHSYTHISHVVQTRVL